MKQTKNLLDPKSIALLANYRLIARLIIDGFFLGHHRGARHAFSLEYSKHREYYPGDSLKLVDWKLYGRTDRFFVKQFEEETNLEAWLVLDISKSMSYRGKETKVTKLEYASCLAAAFAYLLNDQRDLTGLILFDDRLRKIILPRSSRQQLTYILAELQKLKEGAQSSFDQAARLAASRIKKRGLIILFSDLLAKPDQIEKTLKHFLHKGNELVVFHTLSFEELKFPFKDFSVFEDLETKERILLAPQFLKDEYVGQMRQYLAQIKKIADKLKVTYQLLETTMPFDQALATFLRSREKMI